MSGGPRGPQTHVEPCPGCGARGFGLSTLGPDRCTFCDGTENDEAPTPEEQRRAWATRVEVRWPFGTMPDPLSGFSGAGVTMVAGDEASMKVVRRAMHWYGQEEEIRTLLRHQREELGKLAARLRKHGEIV